MLPSLRMADEQFRAADRTVRLWNIDSGEQLYSFQGHEATVHCVTISRDGTELYPLVVTVQCASGNFCLEYVWPLKKVARL